MVYPIPGKNTASFLILQPAFLPVMAIHVPTGIGPEKCPTGLKYRFEENDKRSIPQKLGVEKSKKQKRCSGTLTAVRMQRIALLCIGNLYN